MSNGNSWCIEIRGGGQDEHYQGGSLVEKKKKKKREKIQTMSQVIYRKTKTHTHFPVIQHNHHMTCILHITHTEMFLQKGTPYNFYLPRG